MSFRLKATLSVVCSLIILLGVLLFSWIQSGVILLPNQSKLVEAAQDGNIAEARIALKEGANPNFKDEFGKTPLHRAVGNNSLEVVRLLLKSGADPRIKNSDGEDTLHMAQFSKKMRALLLEFDPGIRE